MDRLVARRRSLANCLLLAAIVLLRCCTEAQAYAPEDPEVQAMAERAVVYLETSRTRTVRDEYMETLGGRCVTALAIYKHRKDRNHPAVQDAVAECQRYAQNSSITYPSDFNYSLGLSIIFLCEIDAQRYASDIQSLVGILQSRQRQDGAWSYPTFETGDTSQTQYAALATWMAHTHGFMANQDSVESMGNWLIRTQDVSGAFAYQGKDPGNFQRIQQGGGDHGIRLSMSPAALGAMYIVANILEINLSGQQNAEAGETEVFQRVEDPSKRKMRPKNLEVARLKEALRVGNNFFERNFAINIGRNQFYYLYSLERYHSFREHLEQSVQAEPAWYNAGVEFLKGTQAEDGTWQGMRGKSIDSAFSVLFLLRSTKQIIRSVSEGNLIGGYGLPADLTKVKVTAGGEVVGTDVRGDIGSLLELIESGEVMDSDTLLAQLDDLQFSTNKEKDTAAFDRLKQMVAGQNYQARLLAVRALANEGSLDNVPVLIYALSDPDARVAREADAGLRVLSRRFSAPRLPEDPTLEQKRSAQYAWRDWLKTVRPDLDVPPDVFTAGGSEE